MNRLTLALVLLFALGLFGACDGNSDSLDAQAKAKEVEEEREKSKTPPKGAPWNKRFEEVHAKALLSGKPIFIYSTKTY